MFEFIFYLFKVTLNVRNSLTRRSSLYRATKVSHMSRGETRKKGRRVQNKHVAHNDSEKLSS
jgi:hypothetical protein